MIGLTAAALVACLVVAPATDASKRSEVRDYAKAERELAAATAPAYHARRDAVSNGCLDVVVDGAPHRFFAITLLYGLWSIRPVIEAAQPEADRLVRRLRRIETRSRPLRRARRAHAGRSRANRRIPGLLPRNLCAVLRDWQAAGWRARTRSRRARGACSRWTSGWTGATTRRWNEAGASCAATA